jgi:hypothetical protein
MVAERVAEPLHGAGHAAHACSHSEPASVMRSNPCSPYAWSYTAGSGPHRPQRNRQSRISASAPERNSRWYRIQTTPAVPTAKAAGENSHAAAAKAK